MNKPTWEYQIYFHNTKVSVIGTKHDYVDEAVGVRMIGMFNIYDNDIVVASFPADVISGWSREKRMESK